MAKPENEPKTDLGKRLRLLRKNIGQDDQNNFAKALGISQSALSSYERGTREPTSKLLFSLADRLSISLDWLFTGEGHIYTDPSKAPAQKAQMFDKTLIRKIATLVIQAHKARGIRLSPENQTVEAAAAYNLLLEQAADPSDLSELEALLPWLKNRLEKTLDEAAAEPGSGKRQA